MRHILQSTTLELFRNSTLKFIWAETSYLAEWLDDQGDVRARDTGKTWKELFREIVARKQLELVGGGWVQHDEALTTTYGESFFPFNN